MDEVIIESNKTNLKLREDELIEILSKETHDDLKLKQWMDILMK